MKTVVPVEATVEAVVLEEPAALKTLSSCGAHWQSKCLQEPPCQKHAVAAAFSQMLLPSPSEAIVAADAASVEHRAIVLQKGPPPEKHMQPGGGLGH